MSVEPNGGLWWALESPPLTMPRALSPSQFLVVSFAGFSLLGGFLLWLPAAAEPGHTISFLDALFTSTSAVCVTGLIVVDTPNAYSTFGEVTIMLLVLSLIHI